MKKKYDSIIDYLKPRIEQTKYGLLTEIAIMYQELENGTLPADVVKALFLLDSGEESQCLEELLSVHQSKKSEQNNFT